MRTFIPILLIISVTSLVWAQEERIPDFEAQKPHTDFLGAGHIQGVKVTTSHNEQSQNSGTKTIDGFPVNNPTQLQNASRFLAQATLGADYETIQMTAAMGFEAWLDEQFALPYSPLRDGFNQIINNPIVRAQEDEDPNTELDLRTHFFRYAWWQTTMTQPDLLRQRLALALSEIFVISDNGSDLIQDAGTPVVTYYDMLGKHSLGNYRTLLYDVTLNPLMGIYLSHFGNPKANPALNTRPDENYAREVMQLFSIGLFELNPDGTCKTDSLGNCIPTYDNDDIKEFAKVFTGLGGNGEGASFSRPGDDFQTSLSLPMKMYQRHHDIGPKTLLNGQTLRNGQSGLNDINGAIDNLYNHPNVGPFIGRKLIQFLVSSNPSPAYIKRVSAAFDDNGQGERGDFKAVVKAILLDPEARNCDPLSNPTAGKLREPQVRYAQFCRAFNAYPLYGHFFNSNERFKALAGQTPLGSPSVFNFFLPDYQPKGSIADLNLVAPEFQIHNNITALNFINEVDAWTYHGNVMTPQGYEPGARPDENFNIATLDFTNEIPLVENPEQLVERLNIILAAGQLSDTTKSIIVDAISQLTEDNIEVPDEVENPERRYLERRLHLALYLILISPDYAILK